MNIQDKNQWSTFVEQLYDRLSNYDIQQDPSRYNVADLNDWGQADKSQGIKISSENFLLFLEKISQFGIELKNYTPNPSELELLNYALDTTLKGKIGVSGNCTMKGDFVKLSDVKKETINCPQKFQELNIYGSNKIFIDEDFDRTGEKLKLVMIAPEFQVVGMSAITLNGKNGADHTPTKATNDNGLPGFFGQSSGSLLIISENIVVGDNLLSINANGGNGGNGQDGSDGRNGNDGYTAPTRNEDYKKLKIDYQKGREVICSAYPETCGNIQEWGCESKCIPFAAQYDWCHYTIPGKPGEKGSNGFDGGVPGQPGEKGMVKIMTKNNLTNEIKISNENGSKGSDGGAGIKGIGGKYGDLVHLEGHRSQGYGCTIQYFYDAWIDNIGVSNDRAPDGMDGKAGQSGSSDRDSPVDLNVFDSVQNYKIFFREKLIGVKVKYEKLFQFYEYLEKNVGFEILNNKQIEKSKLLKVLQNRSKQVKNSKLDPQEITSKLVKEMKLLEEQFIKLVKEKNPNKNNFVHFFESFLRKLDDYIKSLNPFSTPNEIKKVIGFLYSGVLSQVQQMKFDPKTVLIIKIVPYLELLIDNFRTLKKLEDKNNKSKMIQQYKNDYKQEIDNKIDEANNFINEKMKPEMNRFIHQIDDDVDRMVKEVIELEEKAKKDKKKLEEKKIQLQETMRLHLLFNSIKMLGTFVSILGPYGQLAGTVINTATGVAESVTIGDKGNIPDKLIGDVNNFKDSLASIQRMKINELLKSIDEIEKEIKKYGDEQKSHVLNDTSKTIDELKEKLKNSTNKQAKAIREDLKIKLNDKKEELKQKASEKEEKYVKALKVINGAQQMLNVGLETYNKFRSDQKKIDTIDEAINAQKEKIQQLEQFENEIHTSLEPILKNMEDDMQNVANSLKTKSQVSLDVTNYDIHQRLKDMRIQIDEITKGLDVQGSIHKDLESLEDSMSTMIAIYDRIKVYQEQQKLANYLANISSDESNRIDVKNPEFIESINRLEFMIRSNLMLKHYQIASDAFKQSIFPFAKTIFNEPDFDIKIPDQLGLNETSYEYMVNDAIDKTQRMMFKAKLFNIQLDQNFTSYIITKNYRSDSAISDAFYTWTNDKNRQMIHDLLSGKEVITKARAEESLEEENAIKFKFFEVNFKAKNESFELEMKKKLNAFLITATHIGDSKYRVNDKFYTIMTPSQKIKYSFEIINGTRTIENDNYKLMKDGDFVLSPFSSWKFQLTARKNGSYSDLEKYKDEVDLELIGLGKYIESGIVSGTNSKQIKKSKHDFFDSSKKNITELEVEKYYEPDEQFETESLIMRFKNFTNNLFGKFFFNQKSTNEVMNVISPHLTNDYLLNPRIESKNQNRLTTLTESLDTNGSLLLGQLVAAKIYGKNKTLNDNAYLTPDQERELKINEVTNKVLSTLGQDFNHINYSPTEWHKNLFENKTKP